MTQSDAADGLSHSHVFLGKSHDENARRTLVVVAITAVMMVAEIVAGLMFGSMALLADGLHMATHAGALAIAAGAYAFARRHALDRTFTFGTGKVGDLAGFASAVVLGIVAIGIAVESIRRVIDPGTIAFGQAAFVAVVGLIVNVACAFILGFGHSHGHHDDSHHHGSHEHSHQDNNLRSAYVHVLTDALTSVLAIIALLGGRYLGWNWLDPAMGIVGSLVILRWSWVLIRDTSLVLLDTTDAAIEEEIRNSVENHGDARITDLHLWRVGPGAHAAIVSVTGKVDGPTIRERLASVHEVAHLTVECR